MKNPLFRGDFTWRGYKQEVSLATWKWGTRPIYRFSKSDTLRHRGIRYQQFDTRRETTKKFVYINRIEGQIYRDYMPGEDESVVDEKEVKKAVVEEEVEEEEVEEEEEEEDEEEYEYEEEEEDEEEDES